MSGENDDALDGVEAPVAEKREFTAEEKMALHDKVKRGIKKAAGRTILDAKAAEKPAFYDIVGKASKAEAAKPESKAFQEFAMGYMDGARSPEPYLKPADKEAFKKMYKEVSGDQEKVNQWVTKVAEYAQDPEHRADAHRMASSYVKAYHSIPNEGNIYNPEHLSQIAEGYVDIVRGKIEGKISNDVHLEEYLSRVSQNLFDRRTGKTVDLDKQLDGAINAAYNGIEDEFAAKPSRAAQMATMPSRWAAGHLDKEERGLSKGLSEGYAHYADQAIKGATSAGKHMLGDPGAVVFGGTVGLLAGVGSGLLAATELGGHYGKEGVKGIAMGGTAAVLGVAEGAKYAWQHKADAGHALYEGGKAVVQGTGKGVYRTGKAVLGGTAEGVVGLGAGAVWGLGRMMMAGRRAFEDLNTSRKEMQHDAIQYVAEKWEDRKLGKALAKNEKEVKSLMKDLDALEIKLHKELKEQGTPEDVKSLKKLESLKHLEMQYVSGKVEASGGKRDLTHGEKQGLLAEIGKLHQELAPHIPKDLRESFGRKTQAFLEASAEQFQMMDHIQNVHQNRAQALEVKKTGRSDDKTVLKEVRKDHSDKLFDSIMGAYNRNVAQPINDHLFFLMPDVMQRMMPKYKEAAVERSDARLLAEAGNIAALSQLREGAEATIEGRDMAHAWEDSEKRKARMHQAKQFLASKFGNFKDKGKEVLYPSDDEINMQQQASLERKRREASKAQGAGKGVLYRLDKMPSPKSERRSVYDATIGAADGLRSKKPVAVQQDFEEVMNPLHQQSTASPQNLSSEERPPLLHRSRSEPNLHDGSEHTHLHRSASAPNMQEEHPRKQMAAGSRLVGDLIDFIPTPRPRSNSVESISSDFTDQESRSSRSSSNASEIGGSPRSINADLEQQPTKGKGFHIPNMMLETVSWFGKQLKRQGATEAMEAQGADRSASPAKQRTDSQGQTQK